MTFTADINKFISSSNDRIEAVFKQSIQEVIQEAQTDYNKGGFTPRDTSFLINSGQAAIGRVPIGPDERPDDYTPRDWDAGETITTINRWRVGEALYFGWTANYARVMENRFMFMRKAAQNWQSIVQKNARLIASR
jgi:hypothetical protein